MSIRTPLGKAKGLGSAHEGVHHWLMQRATALANVVLVTWFIFNVIGFVGLESYEIIEFFRSPINTILMTLLIITAFYHSSLGLQVIIEDYVHKKAKRILALWVIKFGWFAVAAACVMAILKLHFSA